MDDLMQSVNGRLQMGEVKWDASAPLVMTPPAPNTIHFHASNTTEVMRLSLDGVWVNPDLTPDAAAQAVLTALDAHIKVLVQKAVEAERALVKEENQRCYVAR